MSEPDTDNGRPARLAHADPLAAVAQARAAWLDMTIKILAEHPWVAGVWLVGSPGRGQADGTCPFTPRAASDRQNQVLGVRVPVERRGTSDVRK